MIHIVFMAGYSGYSVLVVLERRKVFTDYNLVAKLTHLYSLGFGKYWHNGMLKGQDGYHNI
jgi:hypothetical protein